MAVTAVLGFVSSNTFALGNGVATTDIALSTVVDSECTIETSTSSFSPNLSTGESSTLIASITEICNDSNGYTVTFSSANNGELQHAGTSAKQDYKISYGSINNKQLNNSKSSSYSGGTLLNAVALTMNLDAISGVIAAGTWSDTITVTVAVND